MQLVHINHIEHFEVIKLLSIEIYADFLEPTSLHLRDMEFQIIIRDFTFLFSLRFTTLH
jgi:hypothetical protein